MASSTTPLREAGRMTGAESCVSNDVEGGYGISTRGNRNQYKDHRKLAIVSVICGLSCLGIVSLIYSVKTREMNKRPLGTEDPARSKEYSRKTFRWALISIGAWLLLLVLVPLIMGLISYLFTFIN